MQIQVSCDWIYTAIGVIGLLFLVGLCIQGIVLILYSLKIILTLLKKALLWASDAKDLVELGIRLDRWEVESRARRIARGGPATLRGTLKVLCWRLWKVYVHPIRSWRGELVYPPKKDVRGTDGYKP